MSALRSAGAFTQNAGSGNIPAMGLPAGHTTGDILVAVISQADNVHGTMTGYTELLYFTNGANHALIVFYKVDGGSETAPTYTHAAGNGAGGFVLAFQSANTTTPFPTIGAQTNGSGSGASAIVTASSITSAYTNSALLFVASEAGSGTGGTGGNNFAGWEGTNPDLVEACDNMAFNGSREALIGAGWGSPTTGERTGDRTVALSLLDAGAHTMIGVLLELADATPVLPSIPTLTYYPAELVAAERPVT